MKKRMGFTLIELMVVISIIAILSVIGVTVFSGVQNKARQAKLSADFDAMYKNIEQVRMLQGQTLKQITSNGCSECGCRGQDANNCLSVMTTSYSKVTTASLPLDPWGGPYTWDENEGEAGTGDCRIDRIRSAGPNHNWDLSTPNDDICYFVPISGQPCSDGARQTDTPCSYVWPQTGL